MIVTNQLITQAYLLPDVDAQLNNFDRLRWYRSANGRNGYFEAATATTAQPAVLRALPITRALNGTSLRLRIHGDTEVEISFNTADPTELVDVIAAFSGVVALMTASADGAWLVLTTTEVGVSASLEVLDSSAAPYLGFLAGESATGLSTDATLMTGTSEYRFTDYQASPLFFYQVEYRSSTGLQVSPRSAAFQSRAVEGLSLDHLIGCYVRLATLTGQPLGGRRVTVHNVFLPNRATANGKTWSMLRQYEEIVTDPNGYAQLWLLRGATIDFTIAGSGFTRRVQVPMTGTLVDLLDPTLNTADEFGIQVPAIDFAVRTS